MSDLKEIGARVRELRIKLNMTQEELAKKVGYTSRSSINKLELGIIDLPQSKAQSIAAALGVPAHYLLTGKTEPKAQMLHPDLRPITTKRFKVLGEIACGQPIYAAEDHESYIDASADIKADVCLIAKGNSMIGARIHDGDIVFIKTQSIVENGDIAAVIIDNEATLKRWYYYPEEQKLILTPENSAYAPLVYMGEELSKVICLGKAVSFMSNL